MHFGTLLLELGVELGNLGRELVGHLVGTLGLYHQVGLLLEVGVLEQLQQPLGLGLLLLQQALELGYPLLGGRVGRGAVRGGRGVGAALVDARLGRGDAELGLLLAFGLLGLGSDGLGGAEGKHLAAFLAGELPAGLLVDGGKEVLLLLGRGGRGRGGRLLLLGDVEALAGREPVHLGQR